MKEYKKEELIQLSHADWEKICNEEKYYDSNTKILIFAALEREKNIRKTLDEIKKDFPLKEEAEIYPNGLNKIKKPQPKIVSSLELDFKDWKKQCLDNIEDDIAPGFLLVAARREENIINEIISYEKINKIKKKF